MASSPIAAALFPAPSAPEAGRQKTDPGQQKQTTVETKTEPAGQTNAEVVVNFSEEAMARGDMIDDFKNKIDHASSPLELQSVGTDIDKQKDCLGEAHAELVAAFQARQKVLSGGRRQRSV